MSRPRLSAWNGWAPTGSNGSRPGGSCAIRPESSSALWHPRAVTSPSTPPRGTDPERSTRLWRNGWRDVVGHAEHVGGVVFRLEVVWRTRSAHWPRSLRRGTNGSTGSSRRATRSPFVRRSHRQRFGSGGSPGAESPSRCPHPSGSGRRTASAGRSHRPCRTRSSAPGCGPRATSRLRRPARSPPRCPADEGRNRPSSRSTRRGRRSDRNRRSVAGATRRRADAGGSRRGSRCGSPRAPRRRAFGARHQLTRHLVGGPSAEPVLDRGRRPPVPHVLHVAADATVEVHVPVEVGESLPRDHRREVRRLECGDVPLVDRGSTRCPAARPSRCSMADPPPTRCSHTGPSLRGDPGLDVARGPAPAVSVDPHTDVAVGHPPLRIDDLPRLVRVRRALEDLRMVGDHLVPRIRVALGKAEALGVWAVRQHHGVAPAGTGRKTSARSTTPSSISIGVSQSIRMPSRVPMSSWPSSPRRHTVNRPVSIANQIVCPSLHAWVGWRRRPDPLAGV